MNIKRSIDLHGRMDSNHYLSDSIVIILIILIQLITAYKFVLFKNKIITRNTINIICYLRLIFNDYLKHTLIGFSGNLIPGGIACYFSAMILRFHCKIVNLPY